MKFFIPHAKDEKEAESVLDGTAKFTNFGIPEPRIYQLEYVHNGMPLTATVGQPSNKYYGEAGPVIAILHRLNCYAVCMANRGFLRGEPIYMGEESVRELVLFDPKVDD